MSQAAFDELLDMVEGDITKENTVMRAAVPAKIKLAATLRFLATGSTYADLQYTFRIHKSTLSAIIPEVCDAIYARLKGEYLKVPQTGLILPRADEISFLFYFLTILPSFCQFGNTNKIL